MELISRKLTGGEKIGVAAQAAVQPPQHGALDLLTATVAEVSTLRGKHPKEMARNRGWLKEESPPGWNPVDHVAADDYPLLENSWDEIYASRNMSELTRVITGAKAGNKRKEMMLQGGWPVMWGYAIGMLSSPEYWPGLLWNPAGGVVRTGLELAGISAAETVAQELSLHQMQPNRDPYESYMNVATNTLFGSVVGMGIGKFYKPSKLLPDYYGNKIDPLKVADEIGVEVHDIAKNFGYRDADTLPDYIDSQLPLLDEARGSGGAAEVGHGAAEKVQREMRWKSGMISALRPLIKARSAVSHRVLNRFFGHDFQTVYNSKPIMKRDLETGKMVDTGEVEHFAKDAALSRVVDREASVFYVKGEKALREGFIEWMDYQGKSATMARIKNPGKWAKFSEEVRYASSVDEVGTINPIAQKTAERVRSEVYAPIEKLAREMEMLDKAAKEGLRKNLQVAQKTLSKTEEATEVAKAQTAVDVAQKALDEFDDVIGDVKYADWYANRRYNRIAIENDRELFKEVLGESFREGKIATAIQNIVDSETDKMLRLQTKIAKKEAALQKLVDKAQKEVDAKLAPPKSKRGASPEAETAAVKKWQKDLKVAQGKLKTATTKLRTDAKLKEWKNDIVTSEKLISRAEANVRGEGLEEEVEALIAEDVKDTYRRILNGEVTGDVYQQRTGTGKPFKERVISIPDEVLLKNGWLQTDMLDQIKSYVNSTLRPIRMKEAAGDLEMVGEFKKIKDDYNLLAKEAAKRGDHDLEKSLDAELTTTLETMELVKDRYYGRSKMYQGQAATIANTARALRNWNVMRMMGGVLITSLNDISRLNVAKIFTPEIGVAGPGMVAALKTLGKQVNREAFRAAGIAHETVTQIKLTKYVDLGEPLMSGSARSQKLLGLSSRGAKALMKATALSEWTDGMKMVAAAMSQNQMVKMMRNYSKLKPKSKTILAEMGIDESFSKAVMREFELGNAEMLNKHASSLNWDTWDDQVLAERMKDILFRQSERILVTPRETDLPIFADNDLGRAFLQFKSFSLAAHNQITVPMLERTKVGDLNAIYALATMAAGGMVTELSKLAVADRLDELDDYSASDYALAVVDRSGAVPALSMWFNNIDLFLGNRVTSELGAMPTSRYSERMFESIAGPSASTIGEFLRVSGGVARDGVDARDARGMRRLAPFHNLAPVQRLGMAAEDYVISKLPKEKRKGRKKRKRQ